jgi:hypothetical protein
MAKTDPCYPHGTPMANGANGNNITCACDKGFLGEFCAVPLPHPATACARRACAVGPASCVTPLNTTGETTSAPPPAVATLPAASSASCLPPIKGVVCCCFFNYHLPFFAMRLIR